MLAAGAVMVWGVAFGYLPALRDDWRLASATLIHLLARGLTPLWYFLGTERVSRAVNIDTVGKVITAAAMVAAVRAPQHGWRVLAVQAAGALVVWLLTHRLLRRECPAAPLSWRGGLRTLHDGFALFVARASGALYMQLNGVLIGLVAAPAAVAMFGGAERVVRAGVGLLEPLTRGLVARLRVMRELDGGAADRLTRQLITWLAVGATLAAVMVVGWAGVIVRVLLGPEYEAAAPVLQRLAPLLPIIAVATALGIFAAVPRGHDRVLLLATGAGGVTNLVLALPLATRFGAEGMAMSVVLAETVVVGILAVWYLRQPPLGAVQS
jgi:PST family polysaccharide transporter